MDMRNAVLSCLSTAFGIATGVRYTIDIECVGGKEYFDVCGLDTQVTFAPFEVKSTSDMVDYIDQALACLKACHESDRQNIEQLKRHRTA